MKRKSNFMLEMSLGILDMPLVIWWNINMWSKLTSVLFVVSSMLFVVSLMKGSLSKRRF